MSLKPQSLFVVIDRYGYVGTFSDESKVEDVTSKFPKHPFVVTEYKKIIQVTPSSDPLTLPTKEYVWIILHKELNIVLHASNDFDDACFMKNKYVSIDYVDEEADLDYWKQEINTIPQPIQTRLYSLSFMELLSPEDIAAPEGISSEDNDIPPLVDIPHESSPIDEFIIPSSNKQEKISFQFVGTEVPNNPTGDNHPTPKQYRLEED
jgi:hypothetical protein